MHSSAKVACEGKPRIITAQAAADLFGPLGWVVLERQSRQLVCRICGGRTEHWELRRLFHNRQKLLEFAGIPYAEISTTESFAVVWLICRVVILSNPARAKFRLHGLSQRIFPLGRCPLCRGPPLKGVLVLPLPKAFDLQGRAGHGALHGRTRYQERGNRSIRRTDVLCRLMSSSVTFQTAGGGLVKLKHLRSFTCKYPRSARPPAGLFVSCLGAHSSRFSLRFPQCVSLRDESNSRT